MGAPCACEMEQPTRSRKKYVSLGFSSDDDYSEETPAYRSGLRRGDVEAFYQYNPERILLEREALKEELLGVKEQLCARIVAELTERQLVILHLRAEEMSFGQISEAVGLCERSVYYEWSQIREVANHIVGM